MKKLFAILVVASIVAVAAFADTTTTTVAKAMTATTVAKAKSMGTMSMAVTGKIVSYTANTDKKVKALGTLVVADSAGKEVSVLVIKTSKIVDAKMKKMAVKDLKAGAAVTVDYTTKGATKITL